jgi:hypothetical protein
MMIGLLVFVATISHPQKPREADDYICSIMDLVCCVKDPGTGAKHKHTVQEMLNVKKNALTRYAGPLKDRQAAPETQARMDRRVIAASDVLAACTQHLANRQADLASNLSRLLSGFSGGLYDFLHVASRR